MPPSASTVLAAGSSPGIDTALIVVIGVITAIIAGVAGILVTRRQFSGQVGTATAQTLFEASESMRHDLIDRLDKAEAKIVDLTTALDDVHAKLDACKTESAACKGRVTRLQRRVTELEKSQ